MEWLKKQEADSWLLKGFIFFSLIFPAFYSPYTDVYQSAYYGGFSWAYFFLMLYLVFCVWKEWKNKNLRSKGCMLYLAMIGLYNIVSLYFNYKYLHWYWEQINNTIAFLFLGMLIFRKKILEKGSDDIIRFLIHSIVVSNAASILYFLLGYTKLLICNNQFVFYEGSYKEFRHYWIYSHKSEYAVFLIAFLALFVVYREKFKNRFTFGVSSAVLLVCLYLTHSWTGILGCLLIFVGAVLDRVDWRKLLKKKSFWAAGGILVLLVAAMGYRIAAERNIMTLNGRTGIWRAALEVIRKYPQGWGMRFGESVFASGPTHMVNNAHNLFLNAMLRFSVPVGICFTILFVGILIYSLYKAKSFLATGMWLAILAILTMDYALMSLQMAMLFLVVYLVCFYRKRAKNGE